jgi:phosphoglycolate phosphatase-like HAD superfamily hydrolase
MKLLLFDIDGTILHTHGVGRRSVERVLSDLLDRPIDTQPISFSGKTDPQILREVLELHGLQATPELLDDVLDAYIDQMETNLPSARVTLLDGVSDLIAHLHTRDDVQLALLTGNLEPLAYRKLQAVDLDHFFDFGAFGSDHADRPELPAIAIERARERTGRQFNGSDVVIIGDTEHDIHCGRGVGAFSVAVATGHFSCDHLAPFAPDVLLDDLTDHDVFCQHVLPAAA